MNEEQILRLGLSQVLSNYQQGLGRQPTLNEVMEIIEEVAKTLGYPCIDSNQTEENFTMEFKRGGL